MALGNDPALVEHIALACSSHHPVGAFSAKMSHSCHTQETV